jgi:thioredoxin-related protein
MRLSINLSSIRVILVLYILVFTACKGKSQQKPTVTKPTATQINWIKDINQALAMAKKQNKMLFVECYTPTCPVCQSMEPVFKQAEVIKKYNEEFVSYKLDVGVAEQVKWLNAKKLYLPSFPQFLYFDSEGNLNHQGEITANAKSFIDAANMAHNVEKRSATMKNRFETGERSVDFLINYANYCRLIMDTTSNHKAANELFNVYPKDQLGSVASWRITKKCVTSIDNGFAKYWFDNVKKAGEYDAAEGHGTGGEFNILGGIIQASLYGKEGQDFSVDKLQEVKQLMAKANAGQYAENATWQLETRALIKENRTADAYKLADRIFEKFKNNHPSLLFIAKWFIDSPAHATDKSRIENWLNKAKTLSTNDATLADYYYVLAAYQLLVNNKTEAKSSAMKGLGMATKAKADISRFNELLTKIQ